MNKCVQLQRTFLKSEFIGRAGEGREKQFNFVWATSKSTNGLSPTQSLDCLYPAPPSLSLPCPTQSVSTLPHPVCLYPAPPSLSLPCPTQSVSTLPHPVCLYPAPPSLSLPCPTQSVSTLPHIVYQGRGRTN
ncbi:hypothetical protein BgiMline_008902 [Biomphalaria glabrata]|nr:hypothetical protein BgiMline_027480 [Biomphalaria glabrata]